MPHDETSEEEEEEEEVYPPWLENIVKGEYYDHVRVLRYHDKPDSSHEGHKRCKEIEVPDAADAAAHQDASDAIRKYRLTRLTPVLIVSSPTEPPYLGLVDKIWLKRDAKPVAGQQDTFCTGDFSLECYWFYRAREVPETAWEGVKRKKYKGAEYSFSKKKKLRQEEFCERQLLFSSHNTLHDYPDDAGLLSLEGFLQTCTLHWLGLREPPPERYAIAKGRLMRTREPGFVVQGFLWCAARDAPQLHPDDKRVMPLDGEWPDQATQDIVASMRKRYKRTAAAMQERNRLLKETAEVHAAYLRVPGAPFKQLADDDGSLTPEAQQQRQERLDGWRAALQQQQQQQHQSSKQQQKHGNPPSPTLPGMHGAAPAGQEDDDEDDDGGGLFGDAPPRQQGNMGDFMAEDDD
uniref:BAH domain-containing protein n=1 Tax=Tetradesmus obliquus TaxID=3088 RepID=A0A383WPB5_TETOB|eukprot:jgi/Sobl393_1/1596/SZX78556.1